MKNVKQRRKVGSNFVMGIRGIVFGSGGKDQWVEREKTGENV